MVLIKFIMPKYAYDLCTLLWRCSAECAHKLEDLDRYCARWTSWRRRRRWHCYLFIASKAHTSRQFPTVASCVPKVLHTRAHHACALSGVSECTKSYHLIAIHININSIFITLHLPLCGKSFCHIWHTHTLKCRPIRWKWLVVVVIAGTAANDVVLWGASNKRPETKRIPRTRPFVIAKISKNKKKKKTKMRTDDDDVHTNLFIAFKTNSQLAVFSPFFFHSRSPC